MNAPNSIVIADDHRLFAEGLRSLLTDQGFEVRAIIENGAALLHLLEQEIPDLLLLDITMGEPDGISLSAIIKKEYPAIKILIISMHARQLFINKLLQIGVNGYILKNTGDEELHRAIATILNGDTYFSDKITDIVIKSRMPARPNVDPELTPRETNILQLIADGYSTREIAEKLFVSINTIESHRKNMLLKTGLRNVAHLVKWAYENGRI